MLSVKRSLRKKKLIWLIEFHKISYTCKLTLRIIRYCTSDRYMVQETNGIKHQNLKTSKIFNEDSTK
jgi:hypothetical protein